MVFLSASCLSSLLAILHLAFIGTFVKLYPILHPCWALDGIESFYHNLSSILAWLANFEFLHNDALFCNFVQSKNMTKGKDTSESGKQKLWTHFLLKIQILKGEWWSHLPMKRKRIRFAQPRANLRGTFSVWIVHWRMAQPFTVKNLNFEQKMGYGFYLPDSLMSQPLVFYIAPS